MTISTAKVLTFNVLVEENGDYHFAHCLETGLVAAAPEESDAIAKMCKMLDRQIKFALKHSRLRDIYHPAPKEVWDRFQATEECVIQRTQKRLRTGATHNAMPGFVIEQTYAAVC
jgi:hypothetical protein